MTTTATVLTEAIFREGLKYVTSGANPIGIQRGINKAVAANCNEVPFGRADQILQETRSPSTSTLV